MRIGLQTACWNYDAASRLKFEDILGKLVAMAVDPQLMTYYADAPPVYSDVAKVKSEQSGSVLPL